MPFSWCVPYLYTTEHLPTVFHTASVWLSTLGKLFTRTFHTASVWLTVALAGQRYVHVCHAGLGKCFMTIRLRSPQKLHSWRTYE